MASTYPAAMMGEKTLGAIKAGYNASMILIDDDFKFHLQKIADGNNFNEHYKYLLNKYLCGNENAVMKVNNSKINNFFYYCIKFEI